MKDRNRKRAGIHSGGASVSAIALMLVALLAPAVISAAPVPPVVSGGIVAPDFIPGEVVVSLKGDWRDALQGLLGAAAGLLGDGAGFEALEALQAQLPAPSLVKLELRGGLDSRQACGLLSRLPMVEVAEPNYVFRASETTPNDPSYSMQWDLRKVGASRAWDIERGSDAFTVAVVDTGVDYTSQEFASRCVPGYDYFHNDPDPMDDDGHGTAVASVIGAATNNGKLVAGMTWAGKIMPLKALNAQGEGTNQSVSQSIYHAANNGARIINMSFTSSEDMVIVHNAVNYAYGKGCLMTAAVGNEGTTRLDYPAAYSNVIGVGSVNVNDAHSAFSNHNASVDLVAPGEYQNGSGGITVALPGNVLGYSTGTSIATPHVAGAALLVWADDPSLTNDQVWVSLRDGAVDLGAAGWDEYYGYGRLDVMEALARISVTIQSPAPYSFEPTGFLTAQAQSLRATGIARLELYADGVLKDAFNLPTPASPVIHTFTGYNLSALNDEGGHRVEVRAVDTTSVAGSGITYYYVNQAQPRPSTSWYLAEGTTAWGFDTWVLIQNPNPNQVTVNITYMKPTGPQARPPLSLPGNSRTTIQLNAEVADSDVSTYIEATGGEVIVERSMYWNDRRAGHDSIGVNNPSTSWYLAEGTTAWGFEEYLLVQNPNQGAGQTAHVTFDFMRPDGSAITPLELDVAPASRQTVLLNQVVPDTDVSVHVTGNIPVICERAMYWNDRTGGHGSIGVSAPSRTWYLAEGTTAWGFEEYVLVQNPGSAPAEVTFSFTNGQSQNIDYRISLAAHSRFTLNAADVVGRQDISTFVYSNTPVIAERAMYWNGRIEGHASIGSATPAPVWYLAEGTTAWGFEEWVLVSNPTDTEVQITLTCMLPGGGTSESFYDLPAMSRYSVNLGVVVDSSDVSVKIESNGLPVMAERAMYWNDRSGGTCSIGVLQP